MYKPEIYWSSVAEEINKRGENYIAGDNNPYYRYKRLKFLQKFLYTINFQSKAVLEVGCGPGGNLKQLATNLSPKEIFGADISQNMIDIASKNLGLYENVTLNKIDGTKLPYADKSIDISFTVTVLQHNTDEVMLASLIKDLCRVTESTIIIMEDIGLSETLGGGGSWIGRKVETYESFFAKHGFELSEKQFLNTKISRFWYQSLFALYKRFIAKQHKEGDPIGFLPELIMGLPMPLTRLLDNIFPEKKNLAKLVFHRMQASHSAL